MSTAGGAVWRVVEIDDGRQFLVHLFGSMEDTHDVQRAVARLAPAQPYAWDSREEAERTIERVHRALDAGCVCRILDQ